MTKQGRPISFEFLPLDGRTPPVLNGSISVYFDELSEFSLEWRCRKAVSTFEASQRPLAISSPSRWSTGIQ
ncbi:hypothetical protein PISMIDRAFT_669939 [Pisolithus microcarpus 441]|uniref:Uncharacterized protein n=1 Tax=Pisolithus microcarpus 441 TaxID=765257 RepID=A0A0C9ZNT1_9AGAM|nr:hypothetical protein PISMIDRAFT_669939 [Pisolithus microcarpus 441]